MSGDSNVPFVPPTLARYVLNSSVNTDFDFIEVTDIPEYNLLARPKDVEENQWLKLFVKHVERNRDSSDTTDIFSITLHSAPVDVVVVALHLSEVDHVFLFHEDEAPLNQPIVLNMSVFDTSAVIAKLTEFYSTTSLLTQTAP
jgi:hypothetical protein